MTEMRGTSILAIDGGGTRCRIALTTNGDPIVVQAGSVNVSTDFATATAELRRGLEEVARRAGKAFEDLTLVPAYVGLAGITGPDIADRLAADLPMRHAKIEDDRPAALRGALGDQDGIVAHCGTGSFIAARIGGRMRLAGGWGPVLGDEASAQWVGRRALSRTLDTVDGFLAENDLSRNLLDRFGGAPAIVAFAGKASPAELGALAVEVTQNAAQGDAIACCILQSAADYIATMSRNLGWTAGLSICLTGGIGPYYKNYLPEEMQAAVTPALGEPLIGAIALAEEFRKEITHERR
ncbi:MAG: BadF/BadG/BcrA/BcrD ATPase family protein [Paracoccaceae bacterium]|nr:BadF/BadG/BcrA/BcrD ATPase family protein [Paracoccaceae bacterium]